MHTAGSVESGVAGSSIENTDWFWAEADEEEVTVELTDDEEGVDVWVSEDELEEDDVVVLWLVDVVVFTLNAA